MPVSILRAIRARSVAVLIAASFSFSAHAVDLKREVTFIIPPQQLSSALLEFSRQAQVQVMSSTQELGTRQTPGVNGKYPVGVALGTLLHGTGLRFRAGGDSTIMVVGESGAERAQKTTRISQLPRASDVRSSAPGDPAAEAQAEGRTRLEEVRVNVPEVLVVGSKVLNMDIARGRDDAQPYVIFGREQIERSGASTVEDFLKQRLTMNTTSVSDSQSVGGRATSQINLRGLGSDQTLILIDGHRTATGNSGGAIFQADVNGIPLAAIERIEVLPTTASGIYGGSATGGVVNIVLRRDYSGIEVSLNYGNTFRSDAGTRRVDLSAGTALGDKTNLLLAGSYSDASVLTVAERDFFRGGRQRILENNPSFFLTGAPPVGATTNIRSLDGAPLFGAGSPNITHVPVGYAGGGGLAPLQQNAGSYNFDLAETSQPVGGARSGLVNAPTNESLTATLRHELTASLQGFLEAGASNNIGYLPYTLLDSTFTIQAGAPNNPFGQAIQVTVPVAADAATHTEYRDRRIVAGLILALPRGWKAESDYTWNRTRLSYENPPDSNAASIASAVANGSLDLLRDTIAYPIDYSPYYIDSYNTPFTTTLKDVTLRLAGPVGSLPGGSPTVSLLLELRDESYGEGYAFGRNNVYYSPRAQSVDSAYLEAKLPLFSSRNAMRAVQELELQIAGRRDDYTVKGSTNAIIVGSTAPILRATTRVTSIDPTIGLRYKPVRDLMLRASYGTGFRPPTVAQVTGNPPSTNGIGVSDPRRGNTPSGAIQQLTGGNSELRPEESRSWSAGFVFTPRVLDGLRLSADYTRIDKSDNMATLTLQQIVNNESLLPGRVTRGPVTPGDPFGVGAITMVDATRVNLSRAFVRAYDVALDYTRESAGAGTFELFVQATWQTRYATQVIDSAPVVDALGIGTGLGGVTPLKFKANAGATWTYRAWTLGWQTRYFDSYFVADPAVASSATIILNQGSARVPSQIYHDLSAGYRFDERAAGSGLGTILSGTDVQLGIRNVFDREPPFDANNIFYYYSTFGDPRLSSYYLSVRRSF